jgi:LysM repeat protein
MRNAAGVALIMTAMLLGSSCRSLKAPFRRPAPEPLLGDRGGAVPPAYARPAPAPAPADVPAAEMLPPSPAEEGFEFEPFETEPVPAAAEIEVPEEVPSELLTYTVKKGDNLWEIARMYGVTHQELAEFNRIDLSAARKLAVGTVLRIPPGGRFVPPEARPPVRKAEEPVKSSSGGAAVPGDSTQARESLPPGGKYVVKQGDSLWIIHRRFDVSMDEIRRLNDLTTDVLQIGQVLILPASAETGAAETGTGQAGTPAPDAAGGAGATEDELEPLPPADLDSRFPQTLEHTVIEGDTLELLAVAYRTSVAAILAANPGLAPDTPLTPNMKLVIPVR